MLMIYLLLKWIVVNKILQKKESDFVKCELEVRISILNNLVKQYSNLFVNVGSMQTELYIKYNSCT